MVKSRLLSLLYASLLLVPGGAAAAPFSSVVVFGDSLSDSGNVFRATGFPPAPYAQRFSNGPVAVEYMATALGLPLVNYAHGGATTGSAFFDPDGAGPQIARPNFVNARYSVTPALPNMLDELATHLGSPAGVADPTALYVVWGGPNDLFLGQLQGRVPAQLTTVLTEAVTNITTIAGTLVAKGATRILVPGMPDLGLVPSFASNPAAGSALAAGFNANLKGALGAFLPPGSWQYFDTFGFLNTIVANPAAYGFTNVTASCVDTPACITNSAVWDDYLFWDSAHPTTGAHLLLGQQFAQSVPEPATLILLGLSAVALAARRRARR